MSSIIGPAAKWTYKKAGKLFIGKRRNFISMCKIDEGRANVRFRRDMHLRHTTLPSWDPLVASDTHQY